MRRTGNCIFLLLFVTSCSIKNITAFLHSPLNAHTHSNFKFDQTLNFSPHDENYNDNARGNEYTNGGRQKPNACLVGYISPSEESSFTRILQDVGFGNVIREKAIEIEAEAAAISNTPLFKYKYVKASGMLKLMPDEDENPDPNANAPKYIPVQSGEENLLVANGWSFLDPDESEPMSAFDIDAANSEGQYKPKWNMDVEDGDGDRNLSFSLLGFDLSAMGSEEILREVEYDCITPKSREILLEGGTDKPNVKITNNGYEFSGSISTHMHQRGLFTCAIGGNPLFTTNDLSPLTASSGWLTFIRPVSEDHIRLVYAEQDAMDQRVEVVDSKTGCHLGHYFGTDGYCINASALNFFSGAASVTVPVSVPVIVPASGSGGGQDKYWNKATHPISWQAYRCKNEQEFNQLPISQQIIRDVLLQNVQTRTILFGAGCFWHVEHALRRMPSVVETTVGYAGGSLASPTYEDVCQKQTNHAEVVRVDFDPSVCEPQKLIDCFLVMHDPTNIRSHGKRAKGTGQYRSCIFTLDDTGMEQIAEGAVIECRKELSKVLSTEVRTLPFDSFWVAEDRHQLHDQRVKNLSGDDIQTLSVKEWLLKYGRRSSSIFGSSETVEVDVDDSADDGMAMMMI